jgi:hypothetical protein
MLLAFANRDLALELHRASDKLRRRSRVQPEPISISLRISKVTKSRPSKSRSENPFSEATIRDLPDNQFESLEP